MIRINLLTTQAVKKKSSGNAFTFVLFGVALLSGLGVYYWMDSKEAAVQTQTKMNKELEQKITNLKQVQQKIEKNKELEAQLKAQNFIFESLEHDKKGPFLMLSYLSYILDSNDMASKTIDEKKAMQDLQWNKEWDTNSVWLVDIAEKDGLVIIKGEARSHEDVAEFYRRLEAGVFFYDITPISQEVNFNDALGLEYVEFKVSAELNYNIDGVPVEAPLAPVAPKSVATPTPAKQS